MSKLLDHLRLMLRRRREWRELRAMTDDELRDLGITRGERFAYFTGQIGPAPSLRPVMKPSAEIVDFCTAREARSGACCERDPALLRSA